MTDISRLLAVALDASASPGEVISPVELAAEAAQNWDKPVGNDQDAGRTIARAALAEALSQVMVSAQLSAARGEPPPGRLISLFRWLCSTLSSWSEEADSKRGQLAAALFVLTSFGINVEVLIKACPAIGANVALQAELAASISVVRTDYGNLNAPGMPLWEREFAERFIAADAAQDWIHLAEAWPRLEAASRPSSELSITVRLLAYTDCPRLAEALHSIKQMSVAMQMMSVLTLEQRLDAAARSKNPVIAFAALHQSFRRRSMPELPDTTNTATTELLCRASGDIALWRGWMAVFGRYPPNYAALQVPLGHALAQASSDAVAAYIETLALEPRNAPNDPSRIAVSACLKAFRERADTTRRKDFWLRAFQRWSAWRFKTSDRDVTFFELRWSDLDYAVYQYALECLSEAERLEREAAILMSLSTIGDHWHGSQSLVSTEWFRLLSELQPYANAQAVQGGLHAPDDVGHAFMPAGLQNNRYAELMFGQLARSKTSDYSPVS